MFESIAVWLAPTLAVLAGLSEPFVGRLMATGIWAGRALMPPELAQLGPRTLEGALTSGWPAYFYLGVVWTPFAAALLGMVHAWWLAVFVLVGSFIVDAICRASAIAPRNIDHYLAVLMVHAARRAANYARDGDAERALAARKLSDSVARLVTIYLNSDVPAPWLKQAQGAPFGDEFWLMVKTPTAGTT